MSYILNIDTSTEIAHVSIAKNGHVVQFLQNHQQKDHASFIQIAIKQLVEILEINLKNIDAIGLIAGPGSYTGLRVGMASAKGLCYALQIPLIILNTLKVLASDAQKNISNEDINSLFCPMIDARRMEVFTAVYNNKLEEKITPTAMILNETSFLNYLDLNKIYFIGSGTDKWKNICTHPHAHFLSVFNLPAALASLSFLQFLHADFAHLAYSEPIYIKDFQSNI